MEATLEVNTVTTTTIHFSWTEEQIAEMLRREVDSYMNRHYAGKRASIDVRFGARYEGGIDASATATVTDRK